MIREEIESYVKKWMDSHEPDTFIRNASGQAIYSAGRTSLNIQVFFEMLLQDYIEDVLDQSPELQRVKEIYQIKKALEDSNEILGQSWLANRETKDNIMKYYAQNVEAIKLLNQYHKK